MKLRDFLTRTNKQAKIENEDFAKALDTIPEAIELPDVWVNLFDDNFLTRERAQADSKIHNKIRAEVLDAVDTHLKNYLPFLDAKEQAEIEAETDTYKKLKLLKTAIPAAIEKNKTANPDVAEQVKEYKKQSEDLVKKIQTINSEREAEKAELEKKYQAEKSEMKLDWTLEREFGKFTFADEFKPTRDSIIKIITTDLKSKNTLSLGDNGQVLVMEEDPATKTVKQKFNGNDPVTLDKLLDEATKPFIKQNNADGKPKPESSSRTVTPATGTKAPHEMTLQERRAAGVRLMG
jgi:hypothetical protein